MNLDDTIVAVATPPGRGGIGVVRLSGSRALEIARPMLRVKNELEAGRAVFGELIETEESARAPAVKVPTLPLQNAGRVGHPTLHSAELSSPGSAPAQGRRIDEIVVTYFAKPHSYTTEDVVEISAHGSPVVLRHIVEMCVASGARLAEPGEFTMRAFLNGRIDLTQAEAVRDLIESQTVYQAKVAAQQLDGALSRRLKPIKSNLVHLIAQLEAGIDFAEDDVSVLSDAVILEQISDVKTPLEQLRTSFAFGKIVHEGLTLAIVGRPNVGKSSLFNRLVERERAIVTATPGTTRDLVTETVAIGGIPVKLVDTAGIRQSLDEAESMGIQKSMEALTDADLVLVVLDASREAAEDDRLIQQASSRPRIVVRNKIDLGISHRGTEDSDQSVRTSAVTGEGIAELRAEILRHIRGDGGTELEQGFLTNVRHQGLIQDSLAALTAAEKAVAGKIPHEMLLLDLYNSLRPLDAITGATTTDDILNLIFSTFCIGK